MNLAELSNADLIDRFVDVSEGEDPGPEAADAVGDIENAGEDMESNLVKKARKILIKYIRRKENGEDAETDEEEEEDEQDGGRRRKPRKSRRGRKSRKTRRGRKTRKGRKSRRIRRR